MVHIEESFCITQWLWLKHTFLLMKHNLHSHFEIAARQIAQKKKKRRTKDLEFSKFSAQLANVSQATTLVQLFESKTQEKSNHGGDRRLPKH